MTIKNPKVSGSQIAPRQKIKVLPDSNLIGILKPEHYEIVDPGSLESIGDLVATLPSSGSPKFVEPDPELPEGIGDDVFAASLEAPNLDDITLVKSETYFDINNNEVARFTFKIRNHVGELVVGVSGYGS